jgi:hypothetical protein
MKGLNGYLKTSIVLSACILVIAIADVTGGYKSEAIHYLVLGSLLLLNQILAYRINNKNK